MFSAADAGTSGATRPKALSSAKWTRLVAPTSGLT